MITLTHHTHFRVFRPLAVAIGTFDGIHLGHKALLEELNQIAQKKNFGSCILTFEPHPRIVLGHPVEILTTVEEKIYILNKWNIDVFIAYPFTKEFSSLHPEEYVRNLLIGQLNTAHVMVGYDHRFGKNRTGDVDFLRKELASKGIEISVVDAVRDGSISISSTRIRQCLKEGRIAEARRLLGYPYMMSGSVIQGEQRGKNLGFPTANLRIPKGKLIPPNGVYAAMAKISGKDEYLPAAVNIGINPTFHDSGPIKVEAHIMKPNLPDLYGKKITLHLADKIREEKKFDNTGQLVQQIQKDLDLCRNILSSFSL